MKFCSVDIIFLLIVSVWESHEEGKMGPCLENWYPLVRIGTPDLTIFKKCIIHLSRVDVQTIQGANEECSLAAHKNARVFRPENQAELNNLIALGRSVSKSGVLDIKMNGGVVFDREGNELFTAEKLDVDPSIVPDDDTCYMNSLSSELHIRLKQCSNQPFEEIWCEYQAKPILTDYECDGWLKMDVGSSVNCYFVQRQRTTPRNARHSCRKMNAQLVTLDTLPELSYITRLAKALVPKSIYRSLLLGYTCKSESTGWFTMHDNTPMKSPFVVSESERDEKMCCLELNHDSVAIFDNKTNYEVGTLTPTYCNKYIDYFICKKPAKGG